MLETETYFQPCNRHKVPISNLYRLTNGDVRESIIEELLVIRSMAPKSIIQVIDGKIVRGYPLSSKFVLENTQEFLGKLRVAINRQAFSMRLITKDIVSL